MGFSYLQFKPEALHRLGAKDLLRYTVILTDLQEHEKN